MVAIGGFDGAIFQLSNTAIQHLRGKNWFGVTRHIKDVFRNWDAAAEAARKNELMEFLTKHLPDDVVDLYRNNDIKINFEAFPQKPGFGQRVKERLNYFWHWLTSKFSRTASTATGAASKFGKLGEEIEADIKFCTSLFGRNVNDIIEIPGTDEALKILSKSDDGKQIICSFWKKPGDAHTGQAQRQFDLLDDGAIEVTMLSCQTKTKYCPLVKGKPLAKTIERSDGTKLELIVDSASKSSIKTTIVHTAKSNSEKVQITFMFNPKTGYISQIITLPNNFRLVDTGIENNGKYTSMATEAILPDGTRFVETISKSGQTTYKMIPAPPVPGGPSPAAITIDTRKAFVEAFEQAAPQEGGWIEPYMDIIEDILPFRMK